MKMKFTFSAALLILLPFLFCSCPGSPDLPQSSVPCKLKDKIPNEEMTYSPDTVYYAYENDGVTFKEGETVSSNNKYNGRPILSVTAKGNGLEITKYHDPAWCYVTIFIKNESRDVEMAHINCSEEESRNPDADTYFYPFVAAGETYKIWLVKQEENWTNWWSSQDDALYVTAIGGEGNFYLKYDSYYYDSKKCELILNNATLVAPERIADEFRNRGVQGSIYDNTTWSGPSAWIGGVKFNKSMISLASQSAFVKNKDLVFVSLSAGYDIYQIDLIVDTIYDKNNPSDLYTMELEGGVKIPSVYIQTMNGWVQDATYHFGDSNWASATMKIVDVAGGNHLEETPILIHDRGNSTKWTEKTPFTFKFESKQKILGMEKSKRWVLMANYYDRSMLRTRLASYLGNNVFNSTWNSKFKPVNLYINNRFVGTYDLGEQIRIEGKRVAIQSVEDWCTQDVDFVNDVNGDGQVDINDSGFIVEIDCRMKQKYNFYSDERKLPVNLKDPDFDSDSKVYDQERLDQAIAYVKEKFNTAEKALFADDWKSQYEKFIDVDSFIDWYLINELAKNNDAIFQTSVYMYYNPATGKIYMGPNWDFDLGFGNCTGCQDTLGGGLSSPTGFYIWNGKKGIGGDNNQLKAYHLEIYGDDSYHSSWINQLMEDKNFRSRVKARWQSQKEELKKAIDEKIVELANSISDYIPENEKIIPRLGKESWNGPDGYKKRTAYGDEVYYLYSWTNSRFEWMDKEISRW